MLVNSLYICMCVVQRNYMYTAQFCGLMLGLVLKWLHLGWGRKIAPVTYIVLAVVAFEMADGNRWDNVNVSVSYICLKSYELFYKSLIYHCKTINKGLDRRTIHCIQIITHEQKLGLFTKAE